MAKNNRVVDNNALQDPYQIVSVQYNPAAGGQKSLIVGPRLIPIQIAGSFTTNVASGIILPTLGMNLAIYNNSGAVGSITVGAPGTLSLAVGAVDTNGNVGAACPPNTWTYLSMGANQYIISSSSTLIVYIMEDPTRIAQETGPYIQQNGYGAQAVT